MKYIFNAQFLKILPPNTSFGDAWDSFCLSLLRQEDGHQHYLSLKAPDRGIDILKRSDNTAIQCKADERGALGTLSPSSSIESLKTAMLHRDSIEWIKYSFATNADYSGDGFGKIISEAKTLGLNKEDIEFFGPDYWSDLCEKHISAVKHLLDYRLTYTETEVEEAFKKARYYDSHITKYIGLISEDSFNIEVANNRTPIVLAIPFAPSLTVKQCLDVAKSLLGLTLEAEHYSDIGTSASPGLALTLDQKAQPFKKKLGEFNEDERKRLKLWVQTRYSLDGNTRNSDSSMLELMYKTTSITSRDESKKKTIERFNKSIEDRMWRSVAT